MIPTGFYRQGWRLAAWLMLLAVALPACTQSSPLPLRIGTNLWIGYEPLYVARAIGELPEEQIRLIEMSTTTDVIHALTAGTLEGAALTLDEVLRLRQEGLDLVVVLVADVSAGADGLVARPEIQGLDDLRGARIGYEQSAVGAVMLYAALAEAGLSLENVTPVLLLPDEQLAAFRGGRVDAVVTYEPIQSRMLDAEGHRLFDSRSVPGMIVDVLAVKRSVLRTAPVRVERLVNGWFKALAYAENSRADALRIMAERQHMTTEELSQAFHGIELADRAHNLNQLSGVSPSLLNNARELARVMVKAGLMKSEPELLGLVDGKSLRP